MLSLKTKVLLVISTVIFLASGHSFPITRHKNESVKQTLDCGAIGPNNSTILGFGNCYQNLYYINIGIGTPSQTFGVQFDTGSNTLWIPTQLVTGVTPTFNTALSSTFKNTSQPGGVEYVDGSGVNGTYGTDKFQIKGSLINITTQYLWVTSQSGMNFPTQVQGLVGMGFTTIPNFLDVAYSNGQIQSPVFALQILNQTMNSSIYYNQLPQSLMNQTIFVPVVGNTYWQVSVVGVQVGGVDMTSYAANVAVIDSGTSFFYVNQDLYTQIINQFFSNCQIFQNTPVCFCNSTSSWPTFAFTFNNVQVYIQPQQYISQQQDYCIPTFGSISGFSQILLGDIFFRAYTITFDKLNQQIGFYGDQLTPVTPIAPSGGTSTKALIGWILLGTISGLILLGIIVLCCIQSFNSNLYSSSLTLNLQQLELSGSNRIQTRFL